MIWIQLRHTDRRGLGTGDPPSSIQNSREALQARMNKFTLLSIILMSGSPVLAQVGATGETTTDMTAKATCGQNSQSDLEKSGTKFTRGIGVFASQRFCSTASGGGSVGRYTDWWTRKLTTYARANANTSVWGGSSSSSGTANVGGDNGNGIKFTLAADADTKGTLTVVVGGSATTNQSAAASVKFGSTTLSWKAGQNAVRQSATVTIGKSGMVFETTTGAKSALNGRGRAAASSYVSISFVADGGSTKCEIKKGVDGCGPVLEGSESSSFFGHTITLKLSKGYPNAFGLRLWSPDGKTVSINKCPVFTDIAAAFAFSTDKDGINTSRVFLSARQDFKMSVEAITLRFGTGGLEWQASNTLDISCTKE